MSNERKRSRVNRIACAWGLAEATLFFFVPDVFLTWVALERPKRAYTACVFALLGALVGGCIMYAWGATDVASARTALDALPGISRDMLFEVRHDLSEVDALALYTGPPRGVPYKIYAVEWGSLGGSLPSFLLHSIPARLVRFLVVTALAHLIRRFALSALSPEARRKVHVVVWLVFYVAYFCVMRG